MNAVSSSELLKNAVHQDALMSRQGLLQRMFSFWFNGFVYNQIWEDPKVDLEALALTPESRVLTIASGGCNILNYLKVQPAQIIAVDLNQYHMYLTRLKLAALTHLPDHAAFFDFFAHADKAHNIENYDRYIKPHLDENTRHFWESGAWIGQRRIGYFGKNLYRYARFGYFVRFLHFIARLAKSDTKKLLQAKTLAEQEAIFQQEIAPFFEHWFVKMVGNLSFSVFSLGIPPQQYRYMKEESGGNLIHLYRQRAKRLFCQFPIQNNYFAWQALSLHYDTENGQALPDYLKAEHYDVLKANVNRVDTHITSLIDFLRNQPSHSLDRFVLLDSQDWMPPAVITALWQEIARVGKPGTRIIFRTASPESPIETALPPALREKFVYEQANSARLFEQDRSAIYGGFHVYHKANH
ncbi:DUF3419 family protein [Thioflexithrix psekupsensis]|uniref:S-adenosylmethionine--diacylglycerol 3-amino-3-carboxypropyl transferase n=1 Tax=Thioflexithrix psekupsensis TaxID=1570016 RepID=A0A251X8P5_9GAMM|nr:DUF3419 family protein [Thioflexithrix psekupsensis]OUD14438.1 S-adenosylmethionine--diacylglycerol 3-amino-3-carboxypropyl transferase [Thioflexithrix psekupsensis]